MSSFNIGSISYPEELPVSAHREDIIALLRRHQVLVIAGETGSGKTTQIPKMCLEAGLAERGRIACTQPRRVAALSISRRIAEELGVTWGEEVGAKIRFTDRTRRDTLIKVMTDGMLLTELQRDSDLRHYSVIIVDEAHERSLNIDFLLGYLRQLIERRRDLKVIITSATIDTEAFSEAFNKAPIIEVSGRTYPVETVYAPIDEILEDTGDLTYIDAVRHAVEDVHGRNRTGDILVFLPGEKDIREARKLLESSGLKRLEILPLFGRLTGDEQDRIFKSSRMRKVILATNIAETSITIPGIRYVIDSGLARVSRYSTQTHTRRLPIEKISQSSANQRRGRAGRLSDGVCIRLYSETDYAARPEYATPEILRSNLADVILRMKAFRIGEIEAFPFIEPPSERAVRSGYELLKQLGALDEERRLTPLGKKLAHLPVDPTVARMLLEAHKEGCLQEVLVIAAGLSIQDPRERPMDLAAEADRMHRRFRHEESDFLTLLNIWNAYHDEMERLSQNQLRKFCKEHFLSYLRMREWRDIHTQLKRTLKEIGSFRENAEAAEYDQIHRALLSGLLSGVAQWEEGNLYRATRNRKVMLFPGSGLFRKADKPKKGVAPKKRVPAGKGVKWILAGEFMETSRLYARTVARIDPQWILKVGSHVLKRSYTDPVYDEKGERVMVRERVLLQGLEVAVNRRAFKSINPGEATEIFIREALVEGRLRSRIPFHEANQELLERLRDQQTRLRSTSGWALEERLYQFYAARLKGVGSYGDLKAFLRDEHGGKQEPLMAEERDLLDDDGATPDEAFPDAAELEGLKLPLAYAYRPGEEDDGATLKVPVASFESVDASRLDWVVPGYIRERIEHLLRGLPKAMRRQLFPLADLAQELALRVRPGAGPLPDQLASLLKELKGLTIRSADWAPEAVPDHLKPRVEVVDENHQTIAAGRDWEAVRAQYEQAVRSEFKAGKGRDKLAIWRDAQARWERSNLEPGELTKLPAELVLGDLAGLPVKASPGLELDGDAVHLRLFPSPEKATSATGPAFARLCARALGRELGWMERDLSREIKRVALGYAFLMDSKRLTEASARLIEEAAVACSDPLPLDPETLAKVVGRGRELLRGLVPRFVDLLEDILRQRDKVLRLAGEAQVWKMELEGLLHGSFLRQLDLDDLYQYPRYMKAIELRMHRARSQPAKDAEKARQLLPYIRKYQELKTDVATRRRLRWLLEEFKVQVFAQELGTRVKVSPKILDQRFEAAASGARR
jgi:ATP-dependent helicase HrpA